MKDINENSSFFMKTTFLLVMILSYQLCAAQDIYDSYRKNWLKKGEQYKPELFTELKSPKQLIRIVENKTQRYLPKRRDQRGLKDSAFLGDFRGGIEPIGH